jgi:hypothetical protein
MTTGTERHTSRPYHPFPHGTSVAKTAGDHRQAFFRKAEFFSKRAEHARTLFRIDREKQGG